jgi:hypothetical protein
VAHHIAAEFGPDVTLIDTADAVAQRTLALAREQALARHLATTRAPHAGGAVLPRRSPGAAPDATRRPLHLWTSGDVATLQRLLHDWLGLPGQVQALPAVPPHDPA